MPFVNVEDLSILEPRPGWRGRFFRSAHMTFAYYAIAPGADVHRHQHDGEEVWHVIDGKLEISLDGVTRSVGAGEAVVVPGGQPHSVRALDSSRVIVVDHPVRMSVGGLDTGGQTAVCLATETRPDGLAAGSEDV
jgi:quercetin dioxygenase-like cupin family protein